MDDQYRKYCNNFGFTRYHNNSWSQNDLTMVLRRVIRNFENYHKLDVNNKMKHIFERIYEIDACNVEEEYKSQSIYSYSEKVKQLVESEGTNMSDETLMKVIEFQVNRKNVFEYNRLPQNETRRRWRRASVIALEIMSNRSNGSEVVYKELFYYASFVYNFNVSYMDKKNPSDVACILKSEIMLSYLNKYDVESFDYSNEYDTLSYRTLCDTRDVVIMNAVYSKMARIVMEIVEYDMSNEVYMHPSKLNSMLYYIIKYNKSADDRTDYKGACEVIIDKLRYAYATGTDNVCVSEILDSINVLLEYNDMDVTYKVDYNNLFTVIASRIDEVDTNKRNTLIRLLSYYMCITCVYEDERRGRSISMYNQIQDALISLYLDVSITDHYSLRSLRRSNMLLSYALDTDNYEDTMLFNDNVMKIVMETDLSKLKEMEASKSQETLFKYLKGQCNSKLPEGRVELEYKVNSVFSADIALFMTDSEDEEPILIEYDGHHHFMKSLERVNVLTSIRNIFYTEYLGYKLRIVDGRDNKNLGAIASHILYDVKHVHFSQDEIRSY